MFPDEISIKILSNFDKKTINNFATTCKYNYNLVNDNEFAIFCEKHDFLHKDDKKKIFEELKKENIDLDKTVYLNCLDFETSLLDFIFRNCEDLFLEDLEIKDKLYLPKCQDLWLSICEFHDLIQIPECKLLRIIKCKDDNEISIGDNTFPKCEILYIDEVELQKLPKIPSCKILFMKYCEINESLDLSNYEIIINYWTNLNESLEYLPNCKLLMTEYNNLKTLNISKNAIVHLMNQDDHERIPNSFININGNDICIHNKIDFVEDLFLEFIQKYGLYNNITDNFINLYWKLVKS